VSPPPPVNSSADVIFVLDESYGVGLNNFATLKLFLSKFVSKLDINSGKARVGLLTFSVSALTAVNLNAHSKLASLQSAISSLIYTGSSATDTAAALDYVGTNMLKSEKGDRANVQNIVVVITHKKSDDFGATVVSIAFLYYSHHSICWPLFWLS